MAEYLYETHLHTCPVSKCGKASVRENLEFYKSMGYAGVFVTNHFIDGNINCDPSHPYEERINFYCSDYEEALKIGKELGGRNHATILNGINNIKTSMEKNEDTKKIIEELVTNLTERQ